MNPRQPLFSDVDKMFVGGDVGSDATGANNNYFSYLPQLKLNTLQACCFCLPSCPLHNSLIIINMKFATAVVMLATMASAAAKSLTGAAARKVLRNARLVEGSRNLADAQGDDAAAQEDEYSFLANYELKMIGCNAAETVMNAEDGAYETGVVLLRLCPLGTCDSASTTGCSSGHGDFVVGIETYVESYFEDQRDNMNWDDAFEVDRYAKCEQYDVEDDGDDANNESWENYFFFIGPTCTADGADIKLQLFEGYEGQEGACVPGAESEIAFETISNGWSLPYSSGGLVSTYCSECTEYNDNGEAELRDLCWETYAASVNHCETDMEFYSYYGQNVQGCEYVTATFPMGSKGGNGGKVFGWIVLALVVVGLVGYVVWWRKKKSASQIES